MPMRPFPFLPLKRAYSPFSAMAGKARASPYYCRRAEWTRSSRVRRYHPFAPSFLQVDYTCAPVGPPVFTHRRPTLAAQCDPLTTGRSGSLLRATSRSASAPWETR